jgi:hypothetical protein
MIATITGPSGSIDPVQTVSGTPLDSQEDEVRETVLDALRDQVATLKDQVRYLQQEGERKDAIIMTMAQHIPELEAASEASQSPTAGHDGAERGGEKHQSSRKAHSAAPGGESFSGWSEYLSKPL